MKKGIVTQPLQVTLKILYVFQTYSVGDTFQEQLLHGNLRKMVRVRLPADPYEGQIYYEPDHELIFEFKSGEWIDITDEEVANGSF